MYTGDAFKGFPDLIAEPNGGRILFATDDFFGEAERLLLRNEPEWIETKYNEFGACPCRCYNC